MHHETGGGLHLEQPYWQRSSMVPNRRLAAARPRGTSPPSHSLVCEPEDPAAQITSVPHAMRTSKSFFFTRCKRKNGSSIQSIIHFFHFFVWSAANAYMGWPPFFSLHRLKRLLILRNKKSII
jgi:hypothetical protein